MGRELENELQKELENEQLKMNMSLILVGAYSESIYS